ncbi:MAG: hypothetical protein MO853_09260 [Candidatus Protistobacter heckmanni]|nr:hypothetical protein [Candidatus Protistobacter heckmanni]
MTTASDAEQLYARLRELVKAGQGAGLAVAGIHSGGAWVATRLAADLGLGECGVINELFDYDRPSVVELAVLADRQETGNRQPPFAPTYAGATLSLPPESVPALSASGEGANTKFAFTIEARGA